MILVTGGTGLVGGHLLLRLSLNQQPIRAIYRSEKNIEKTQQLFVEQGALETFGLVEWIKADLNDVPALERAFEGIDQVYHCAALVSFDPKDEELLRKINIEGTAHLINLSVALGVKKFCYVSSIAALGETITKTGTIDEESNWNPNASHSDYALSKYGGEMEVWRGSQEGLPVVIVNPGLIFGSGYWHQSTGDLFQKVYQGLPFYTRGMTGIIAVEDLVDIVIRLMQSEIQNERFVAVSENICYQDLLNYIADGLHKKRPSLYATELMTAFAWRIDYAVSLFTTKKRSYTRSLAHASHSRYTYNNSKLISLLNPVFLPSKQHLSALCASFLSQG